MSPLSIRICVQYLGAVRRSCRVERKRGYRHTDSWHEWVQDNFYGRSTTKRIVIKEPSLQNRHRRTLRKRKQAKDEKLQVQRNIETEMEKLVLEDGNNRKCSKNGKDMT